MVLLLLINRLVEGHQDNDPGERAVRRQLDALIRRLIPRQYSHYQAASRGIRCGLLTADVAWSVCVPVCSDVKHNFVRPQGRSKSSVAGQTYM